MKLEWNTEAFCNATAPVVTVRAEFEDETIAAVHQEQQSGRILGVSLTCDGQTRWAPMLNWPANVTYGKSVYEGVQSVVFVGPNDQKVVIAQDPHNGRILHVRLIGGYIGPTVLDGE